MGLLLDVWREVIKQGFKTWIRDKKHKIILALLIFLVVIIGGGAYVTYDFFMKIKDTDTRATLYIWLLFLYVYGGIYTLSNNISSRSRKFRNALKENESNVEAVIRNAEYISIFFCIAQIIKNLSPMIIIFMVNLALNVAGVEQSGLDYVYLYTYVLISYFLVTFYIAYMAMSFQSTDIMIVINTDGWYEKKVDKLTKKYKK